MRFIALVCVLTALVGSAAAQQSARHALVIGNDSYQHVEKLINSRSDARSIATALEQSGFKVTLRTDLDLNGFKTALRTFKAQINGGDEAVFFFAGHGVELDGVNYLLPVDIRGDSSDQVKDDGLPLQRVLDDLREKRARFSLAIIDACRNNPFQGTGRSIGGRGLAPTTAVTGQMVLYSAGSGQVALDQLGPSDPVRNGLFTRVLLKEMTKPGAEVREVLRDVRDEVASLAKSVGREQVPALYDQTLGRFYFTPASATASIASNRPAAALPAGADPEERFWADARSINNRAAYEAYLSTYPNGRYAALARAATNVPAAKPTTLPVDRTTSGSPAADPPQSATRNPGSIFKDCESCPSMIVIPAGKFEIGVQPEEEESENLQRDLRQRSEPRRWIDIASFAVGRYEVTRGQYRAFASATGKAPASGCRIWNGKEWVTDRSKGWADPGFPQDDDHPVACVTWQDATAYTQWLSKLTGRNYRLLSEAQWEYAARAGTTTRRYWGNGPDSTCSFSNSGDTDRGCKDGVSHTSPVGRFKPNGFGLFDMLGNVYEWVEDCWNESYVGAPADGKAWITGDCARRGARGGSWWNHSRILRSGWRHHFSAAGPAQITGFRVAMVD